MVISFQSVMAMDYIVDQVTFSDDSGEAVNISKFQNKIKTKSQQQLDSENITEDIQLLMKELPRYEHIQVSIDPSEQENFVNIKFVFQKKRIAKLVRIIIQNGYEELNSLLDELAIRRGRVFRADALERDKEFIRKAYVKAGYPKATVEHQLIEKRKQGDLEVRFLVNPKSKRVKIKKVLFYGNFSIGKDHSFDSNSSLLIHDIPLGFFKPVAIFARKLVNDIPIETSNPILFNISF